MYLVRGKIVFVKKLLGTTRGMTLFPFILLSKKYVDKGDIPNKLHTHENIHIFQQMELLVLPFYIFYGLLSLFYFIKVYPSTWKEKKTPGKSLWKIFIQTNGMAYHKAYRMNWFEREAYANDKNPAYLFTRKAYSMFKYYKKREGNKY